MVKEFYANFGEQKNFTCYVKGGRSLLGKGPSICLTCESSRVPRIETMDDDSARIRG